MAWQHRLGDELAALDSAGARIGVQVRDLASGAALSYRADETWYLASTVKVPVAIAVLRAVDQGTITLQTRVTVRSSDFVDGAGSTNHHSAGTALSVRYLLEQMIVHSDNTASDMLIGLVGLAQVQQVTREVSPHGFGAITTLAEVRRATYGQLTPQANRLAGRDLLLLRQQRSDDDRLHYLARIVRVPVTQFQLPTLDEAYAAYYATGLNSGRLDAYAELLARLAEGRLLAPWATSHLLGLMDLVATGTLRLKAALPPDMRLAHKTGTQRARVCDAGIVRAAGVPVRHGVVIVACVQGEPSLPKSELVLRRVAAAICRSGAITGGTPDAANCPVVRERLPGPAAGLHDR